MATRIQLRRDSAANWTSANPVLAQGEIGIEIDTNKFKVGNGTLAWDSLAYLFDLGNYVTGQASSVDGEITLFSGTEGKALKRSTTTGMLKATSGVLSAASAGTDYVAPGTATTFTATQTFKGIAETQYNLTGTDLSVSNGTIQYKTLTANTTFTESLAGGQSMILGIDDGAAYTVTWPTITWTTTPAIAPTLPTSGYLWVVLWKVGTTLYGKY